MTRTKKHISLILVLVLILSAFSGCAYFYDSPTATSDKVVLVVGDEEITYGQFYSVYSSAYSAYSNYISYGYYTEEYVFQIACNSLVNTYTILNAYKTNESTPTYEHEYLDDFAESKYLTESDMDYALLYVKASVYSSLDSFVEEFFTDNGLTFADEEEDDEGREAPTYETIESIVDETFKLDFDELNEMLENAATDTTDYDKILDQYVFDSTNTDAAYLAKINALVSALNERLAESDSTQTPITNREYIAAQRKAIVQLQTNVYANYGLKDLTAFIKKQVSETVTNLVIQKAQSSYLKAVVESDIPELATILTNYWNRLATNTVEEYILDADAYLEFIESLSDTSFIREVDDEYKLIFVKNLLVPFSDEQTTLLTAMEAAATGLVQGEDESSTDFTARKAAALEDYYDYREQLAMEILAENFTTDGAPLSSFFEYDSTTGKIKLIDTSSLKTDLDTIQNGEDFEELMYTYNTDVAQHTAHYDYVVNVAPDTSYTSSWAEEFQEACEELYDNGNGLGKYTLCVTKYGVHIIYYDSDIAQEVPDFTQEKIYDTSTLEYRFLSYYFDSIQSAVIQDYYETEVAKITVKPTNYFEKVAKEAGFEIPDYSNEE